jgi:hypothetical protein
MRVKSLGRRIAETGVSARRVLGSRRSVSPIGKHLSVPPACTRPSLFGGD